MSNEVEVTQSSNMGEIWTNPEAFSTAARMASALSKSTIVPKEYQRNEGNCIIAIEMANRLKVSPMMVMQNLYIVNGRPAWSSQYIIAMINNSKKYKTEIKYKFEGDQENRSCMAYVEDHDGNIVEGPVISMKMAKDEGWSTKNGSKWKTMPDVMLRYRAASFFGRINCPDMVMGMYSVEEVQEGNFGDVKQAEPVQEEKVKSLEEKLFNSEKENEQMKKENAQKAIDGIDLDKGDKEIEKDIEQESLDLNYPDPKKKDYSREEALLNGADEAETQ